MQLSVEHLCKAYGGRPVLRDVSFSAGQGVTCVMAPSGAGKTTLLRILLGLETADGGIIRGLEGARASAVFQEDRLLEHLTGPENLRFVLGPAYEAASTSVLLERLGLTELGTKPVREYSGGMKRRLSLARALCMPFDLLVLDEPFTGLDGENRCRAMDCIRAAAEGKTVLLVTHDAEDASGLDARIITLQ